jgi:hypothetical protein
MTGLMDRDSPDEMVTKPKHMHNRLLSVVTVERKDVLAHILNDDLYFKISSAVTVLPVILHL